MFSRWIQPGLGEALSPPCVQMMFGARQTGKSTLLQRLIPDAAIWLDFSEPRERSEYLRDPGRLVERCRGLPASTEPQTVVVDEAQAVPAIFDAVQHLYDSDRRRWRFVLCGSSARKLRKTGANRLPGRSLLHSLYPLILPERPLPESGGLKFEIESPLPMSPVVSTAESPLFPAVDLVERMTFGEFVGGHVHRFPVARVFAEPAQESAVHRPLFFFDLGVRHAAAEVPLSSDTVLGNPGPVFEQWVGIELWKRLRYLGAGRLHFFRTKGGAEVDFIVERNNTLTPIEVKWTENPTLRDARHLLTFLEEHPKTAKQGFIVCRCRHPLRLHDSILALPWFCL